MLHTFNLIKSITSELYIKDSYHLVSQTTICSFYFLIALELCNTTIHNTGQRKLYYLTHLVCYFLILHKSNSLNTWKGASLMLIDLELSVSQPPFSLYTVQVNEFLFLQIINHNIWMDNKERVVFIWWHIIFLCHTPFLQCQNNVILQKKGNLWTTFLLEPFTVVCFSLFP